MTPSQKSVHHIDDTVRFSRRFYADYRLHYDRKLKAVSAARMHATVRVPACAHFDMRTISNRTLKTIPRFMQAVHQNYADTPLKLADLVLCVGY